MSKNKYYVVWEGRNPGVYDNWDDAHDQIDEYPGARYKGFATSAEATEAFRSEQAYRESVEIRRLLAGSHVGRTGSSPDATSIPWQKNPEIDHNAWAVDASCLGNPGIMEYRGVDLATGHEVFHFGPVPQGTNNIGEFLAIVHALALCWQRGETRTIYSDSGIAISWVRRRVMKTQLKPSPENDRVFVLLARALSWIRTHSSPCRILKWETSRWGEIPADFNRK